MQNNNGMLSAPNKSLLVSTALASAVVLGGGLLFAPDRAWSNLLVGAFGLLTLGLGGSLFIALTFVTGAGWHVAFRRVPEALATLVPFAGVVILGVLAIRMQDYGWKHEGHGGAGTFWFKELWLTPSFWLLRSAGYVVAWSLLGFWLVRRSRRQDADPNAESRLAGNVRLSALFLVVYALTFSLASADWLMALEPMWFSTIWGVYNFAGMILASLAMMIVAGLLLSRPGRPLCGVFNDDHLHDLGRLLLGFSCFWAYIWFSQYMLIWYANIPEETSYFITRTHGSWGPVVVTSLVLNWIVPFFLLLPKPAKRSRRVMMRVAVVVLVGRWVDLSLMVFPSVTGATPFFGIWEVAAICCSTAVTLALLDRGFRAANPVPRNDPFLNESLHYDA